MSVQGSGSKLSLELLLDSQGNPYFGLLGLPACLEGQGTLQMQMQTHLIERMDLLGLKFS